MSKTVVYSKPACKYCELTKTWLKMNSIEYSEVNVLEDDEALGRIKDAGFMTLPVIEKDGEFITSGFNPSQLIQSYFYE